MRHLRIFCLVTVPLIMASAACYSQTAEAPQPALSNAGTAEKKQTLNFEDELVEGSAQKPELLYLFQKKNFNYKKLIKLRENFIPEMRRTSEDVQRLKGGR